MTAVMMRTLSGRVLVGTLLYRRTLRRRCAR